MNRSQDDINVIKKVNMIVQERLPKFASRYFKANMEVKTPRTLYGYAVDLTSFFEYLEDTNEKSFETARMSISDLNKVSASIIEDYLDYSRTYMDNGETKMRSDSAIKRRYSSLSSFLNYYYRLDMIDSNPATKVIPPRISSQINIPPQTNSNREVIDFIYHGSLEGKKAVFQEKTFLRDATIVTLIASTGIKVSELVELNIEDVHLDELYIIVNARKMQRKVYISESTAQTLGRYLSERLTVIAEYKHDNALFLSLRAKRICIRSVELMIKKYSEAAFDGKEHLTPESIHRTIRNTVFNQSKNVPVTCDICGLDSDTILQYYRPYIDDYERHKGQNFNL